MRERQHLLTPFSSSQEFFFSKCGCHELDAEGQAGFAQARGKTQARQAGKGCRTVKGRVPCGREPFWCSSRRGWGEQDIDCSAQRVHFIPKKMLMSLRF